VTQKRRFRPAGRLVNKVVRRRARAVFREAIRYDRLLGAILTQMTLEHAIGENQFAWRHGPNVFVVDDFRAERVKNPHIYRIRSRATGHYGSVLYTACIAMPHALWFNSPAKHAGLRPARSDKQDTFALGLSREEWRIWMKGVSAQVRKRKRQLVTAGAN